MPCYAPLQAWRSRVTNSASGKRGLAFSPAAGYRDLPVEVACGQCIGCRLERSRQWAVRLVHESQLHEASCFVTLTYDAVNLPCPPSLCKSDFQKFMKRLRKHFAPQRIRFFHCGEYGEQLSRPHYHALLFGVDFSDKVFYNRGEGGCDVFRSEVLASIWGKGFCTVGAVTFESAAYCARYCVQKVTGPLSEFHYRKVDTATGEVYSVVPEYTTMSLKPGIGAEWYARFKSDVFPSGQVVMRGHEMKSPRYYDKLFELEDPKGMRRVKRARARVGFEHREDQTPRRLDDRRVVKEAQVGLLKRSLKE